MDDVNEFSIVFTIIYKVTFVFAAIAVISGCDAQLTLLSTEKKAEGRSQCRGQWENVKQLCWSDSSREERALPSISWEK